MYQLIISTTKFTMFIYFILMNKLFANHAKDFGWFLWYC